MTDQVVMGEGSTGEEGDADRLHRLHRPHLRPVPHPTPTTAIMVIAVTTAIEEAGAAAAGEDIVTATGNTITAAAPPPLPHRPHPPLQAPPRPSPAATSKALILLKSANPCSPSARTRLSSRTRTQRSGTSRQICGRSTATSRATRRKRGNIRRS